MSISVLRTADAWYVQTPDGRRPDRHPGHHHRTAARRAGGDRHGRGEHRTRCRSSRLALVSPVTAPCRVVAQMTNYASHVTDSGMNPDTIPLTFFRKSSGSISGPTDDVIRPAHVRLLDYEVEIGLVIGREMPVGTA